MQNAKPARRPGRPRKSESSPTPAPDLVNPAHYKPEGGVECIEVIKQTLTRDQFIGYLAGNNQKYIFRWQQKGGLDDLRKANWYLDRLIQEIQG
jgi:hypothetical protein